MKFLFDLDGTVTSMETLPLIAEHFNVQDEIMELTRQTVQGNVPFIESFIKRVGILGKLPVNEVNDLLTTVPLYDELMGFITNNKEHCVIVTGNLSCWCEGLMKRIGCECYCSEGLVEDNQVVKINTILRKEQVVDTYKAAGETVVFVGDGNNDLEAMRHADIAIAAGLTHSPAKSLFAISDYLFYNESALCRQLNLLL